MKKFRKRSPTYDLELTIEVPDLQDEYEDYRIELVAINYYDHKSKETPTRMEKGDRGNAKG